MTIIDDQRHRTSAMLAENDRKPVMNGSSSSEEEATRETKDGQTANVAPDRVDTGHNSEHGHNLQKIKPVAKHSGRSVATFFSGLFQTIIAIGTLGTSVTFSYVLTNQTPSPEKFYSAAQVQTFLAISWLLFLLSLAFASLGSTLLTFFRAHWERDWDGEHGKRSQVEVQMYAVLVSGLLGGLIVGAFLFLCLVVVAYIPAVGWTALAFTIWFGLVIAFSVIWQVPWPWRNNVPDSKLNVQ